MGRVVDNGGAVLEQMFLVAEMLERVIGDRDGWTSGRVMGDRDGWTLYEKEVAPYACGRVGEFKSFVMACW
jgi:hypothetical protein